MEDGYETKCEDRTVSVECGSTRKCSRVDMGNGFAKETCSDSPKYCRKTDRVCERVTSYREEPIYADQCGYDTWMWKQVEQIEAKGRDDTPRWPEGNLVAGPLDRVHRLAAYVARIQYRKGGEPREYRYVLPNEARFHEMRKGQSVTLQVRNDGSVLGVLQKGSRD
uniref:Uncharacterized protein n=1 Tax=Archangium gephyra TaxID=48 RepID=A0A7D4XIX0_9BACT|nr:hypothetical protein [Archangium gephyra]